MKIWLIQFFNSAITLIFMSILIFSAPTAQAVVWCHDFVIYTLTGQDIDKTPPATLRTLRTKPLESGFYSKKPNVWFNAGGCKSSAELDKQNFHGGTAALHLGNLSKRASNIYGTMTQEINVLKNKYYAITLWAKAENLGSNGALNIAVDPMWRIRPIALPAGIFGWTRFYKTFNSGDRDSIEFRIIFEDAGDVWLDDIRMEELPENYKE